MNELIEQLSSCQVIHSGTELFKQIERITEDESWFELTSKLSNNGYNISYNSLDGCYVIY